MDLILYLASAVFLGLWIATVARFYIVKRNAKWLHCSGAPRTCAEKIIVIIPARNEERDVERCMESILAQDADLLYHPRCCATAVSEFERGRYDLISLFPALMIKSFWENIILPMYISGFAKFVVTDKAEDPSSPHAAAAGAFMLIKREVLETIGGLESIKGEMGDDVALAGVVKRRGYRIGYRLAPECLRVEIFKNGADAFSNTTKNVLMIVQGKQWLAIPVILYSVLLFWLSLAHVVMGMLAGHTAQVAMGTAIYLLQYGSLFVTRGIFQFRPLKAAFFPLVVVLVGYSISRALYYGLRGEVWWRGRAIRVG